MRGCDCDCDCDCYFFCFAWCCLWYSVFKEIHNPSSYVIRVAMTRKRLDRGKKNNFIELRKKTHQQTRERYGVERNDTKHFIDCRLWINTNHFIAVHPFELDWCDYAMFVLWKWCVQHTESNRFESKCCTESKAFTSRRWSILRDIERERNKRKKTIHTNTYGECTPRYDCNRCKTIWQMIFNGVHHLYRKIMSA